jgi:uncharacterized protein
MSDEPITVVDAPDLDRYEVHVGDQLAGFTEYRLQEGRLVFHHTEIDDAFGGRGLAGKLAAGAMDDVKAKGGSVVPTCSYIEGWLNKHPDHGVQIDRMMLSELKAGD